MSKDMTETNKRLRELAAEFDSTPDNGEFGEDHPIFQMAEDVDRLNAENARLQARIDELMFEHCPDEMTAEQLENWGNNQAQATAQNDIDSHAHD